MRIAYVHARLALGSARLEFMPFGMSLLKQLDRAGHELDIYLAEKSNEAYKKYFSERVRVHFLDQRLVWERPGRVNYVLLNLLFRYLTRAGRVSYDLCFGSGQVGMVLAHRLSQREDCPYIYLSDEFPDVYESTVWRAAEEVAARDATLLVLPDETRMEKLCHQISGLENKNWATLPNTPLMDELEGLPEFDWHRELGLPEGCKPFLQAGGIFDFNQIAESMVAAADWPSPAALLINGKPNQYNPPSSWAHLDCPGRIFWNYETYDDPKFHSLVASCVASFGLYRNVSDLDYVGKSSGKIMRSLGCGKPVIASQLFSLQFIEDKGLGVLVTHPHEIPRAVETILSREAEFGQRCRQVYSEELSFEFYWTSFLESCQRVGLEL